MNQLRFTAWVAIAALAASISIATFGFAQGEGQDRGERESTIGEGIPEAALLTERGRQLAEELKQLRRSEARLGPRHPALGTVREKIANVEEQLQAWLPEAEGNRPLGEQLPEMNAQDLKQLVLRLSAKIEQLERRVDKLENRLEVF